MQRQTQQAEGPRKPCCLRLRDSVGGSVYVRAPSEGEKLSTELYEGETNPTAIADDELKADECESNMSMAVRDCRYLLSQRRIFSNIQSLESVIRGLTAAYEASPENDHSVALNRVLLKTKDLENDLHFSLMTEEEELRGRGNSMLERAYAIQEEWQESSHLKSSQSSKVAQNLM